MGRLTEQQENGFVVLKTRPRGFLCPTRFCSFNDSCKYVKDRTCPYLQMVDRIADYENLGPIDHLCELVQAEKDGRLAVLPCRVGTHIWIDGREAVISEFFGYETERYFKACFFDDSKTIIDVPFCEIGKTVFLTHEAAEAALSRKEHQEEI